MAFYAGRLGSPTRLSSTSNTEVYKTRPTSLTLHRGLVATSGLSFNNQNLVFSVISDITVPVVSDFALFENVEVYEGTYLTLILQ